MTSGAFDRTSTGSKILFRDDIEVAIANVNFVSGIYTSEANDLHAVVHNDATANAKIKISQDGDNGTGLVVIAKTPILAEGVTYSALTTLTVTRKAVPAMTKFTPASFGQPFKVTNGANTHTTADSPADLTGLDESERSVC